MSNDWNDRIYTNGADLVIRGADEPREIVPLGEWTMKDAMRVESMRTAKAAAKMVYCDEVDETTWRAGKAGSS